MRKHQLEIEFLQLALSQVQHMYAAVFTYRSGAGEELLLPKEVFLEIDEELGLLRKDLETKPLPKALIPCADFLADSIFLFQDSCNKAKIISRTLHESHIHLEDTTGFLAQYYKQKKQEELEYLVLKHSALDAANDYYSKALELIKEPARKAGLNDQNLLDLENFS